MIKAPFMTQTLEAHHADWKPDREPQRFSSAAGGRRKTELLDTRSSLRLAAGLTDCECC